MGSRDPKTDITILEKIAPDAAARLSLPDVRDEPEFFHQTDQLFLAHVLKKAKVSLSDNTHNSLEQELQNWNRTYLPDLALRLSAFQQTPLAKKKLKYIIEHSIRDDLPETLSSGNSKDAFSAYNARAIDDLACLGVDLDNWLRVGGNVRHGTSWNTENPFIIEFTQWRRDFRREYPIGNISECCIAVDATPKNQKYKHVLLDYFLDLSIQVLHMRRFDGPSGEPLLGEAIGQTYLIPLINTGKRRSEGPSAADPDCEEPFLGVTSVEVNQRYRSERDIVPVVVEAITKKDGYMQMFSLPYAVFGERFSALTPYIQSLRHNLANMEARAKKARATLTARRHQLRGREDITDITQRIEGIKEDRHTLRNIREKRIPTSTRLAVRKPGALQEIGSYRGTDYLDILSRGSDGFFALDRRLQARGYVFNDPAVLDVAEGMLYTAEKKY